MDPITKAFKESLDSKKLSKKAQQHILTAKPQKKRSFIPQITAVCVMAVALFLLFTNTEKLPIQQAAATAKFGPVDEAILQYFNSEAPKLQMDLDKRDEILHNGDAYLLRLALEQNSGQFYSDSSLAMKDRFLISELLHYIQEAVWQNTVWAKIEQVQTIDQLVEIAPTLISQLKPSVETPYMSVVDEKNHQWNFYLFDEKKWVSYVIISALLVLFIIYLFKYNHRIIGSLVIFVALGSFSQPFWKPFNEWVAYDEHTLVEVVARELKKSKVKVVGEPKLQYAASIYETRTALVSFKDGMSVIAVFKFKNGQYRHEGIMWHAGTIFNDTTFDTVGDEHNLVSVFGFKQGHDVATFRITSENKTIAEAALTKQKPTIIYLKKPADISSMEFHFLNESGEIVR